MRGSKAVGLAVIFALLCMLNVVFIEEFRIIMSSSQFEEYQPVADAVDINTATKEELKTLDGIGDAIAERIIKYRNEMRRFETKEDLMNIRGIGEKLLEKNKRRIVVSK